MLSERLRHASLGLSQVFPWVIVGLMVIWFGGVLEKFSVDPETKNITSVEIHGFSVAKSSPQLFNWHPVLMSIAFAFLTSYAIITYRILPYTHNTNKTVHLVLHSFSISLIILALVAVFTFHNHNNITNLYSLHSWCGLAVVILFLSNYVVAFWHFYFPMPSSESTRRSLVKVHATTGALIFPLSCAVMLLGISEKLAFNQSCNLTGWMDHELIKGYMSMDCLTGNTIGLLLIVQVLLIGFALSPIRTIIASTERSPLLAD